MHGGLGAADIHGAMSVSDAMAAMAAATAAAVAAGGGAAAAAGGAAPGGEPGAPAGSVGGAGMSHSPAVRCRGCLGGSEGL
jgi:hypothetical protein